MTSPSLTTAVSETETVDIRVEGEGPGTSVFLFRPLTHAGSSWLEHELDTEPWQWMGRALAVEHRNALDVAGAAIDAGLVVA